MLVVVSGVARLLVSVRVTSTDTDTTSAMAATMATTPTTQGHRGGSVGSTCWLGFVAVVVVQT